MTVKFWNLSFSFLSCKKNAEISKIFERKEMKNLMNQENKPFKKGLFILLNNQ